MQSEPSNTEKSHAGPIPLRYNLRELSGSLGDLGTFLPITVALSLATGLDFGLMLIAAGLMNIASGFLFRIPVPVQPMKAIAAVAIAEGLSGGEVVAAGWAMGLVLTVLAVTGLIPLFDRYVPRPVVRAIQLGIGAKLLLTTLSWLGPLPAMGADSILTAAIVSALLIIGLVRRWPLVLPVFIAGFVVLAFTQPAAYQSIGLTPPAPRWIAMKPEEWTTGLFHAALPQLPLTLLNSVIAVCALSRDYYPDHPAQPKKMALSVGLMNLLCVGWSGLPMCHGSGGLAAQYRAGARTGGSVIMLGIAKTLAGLAFGVSLITLLTSYPTAILASLVALSGLSLAHAAWRSLSGSAWIIAVPSATVIAVRQTLDGFVLALVIAGLLHLQKMHKKPTVGS